jgi:outer membrane protein assembly factor BamD (BamD/ComL family)
MKHLKPVLVCLAALALTAAVVRPQGKAKQGPDVVRDADLEKDSMHDLEAARFYFGNLRKAYVASLQRCEEIIAANPNFSKLDEALFIAGESNLYLADGKGKQKPSQYKRAGAALQSATTLTPEEFRAEARAYLTQLVEKYPDSKFKAQAVEDLKLLGDAKPKESKP